MTAPPPPPPLLTTIAWHEAGHAVVAYALGYALEDVTIAPTGEALGSCGYHPTLRVAVPVYQLRGGRAFKLTEDEQCAYADRQTDRLQAIIAAAGALAAGVRFGHSPDMPSTILSGPDYDTVHQYAEQHSRSHPGRAQRFARALERARRLVSTPTNQRAISALATALLARSTIDGPAAEQILSQFVRRRASVGATPPWEDYA